MIIRISLLVPLALLSLSLVAQTTPNAHEIIDKSISYHDPSGILTSARLKMKFEESRPNGTTSTSHFILDPSTYDFEVQRNGSNAVTYKVENGQFSGYLNGKSTLSEEEMKKYRINEDRALMMRNYYHYLWYLPVKLKDPGTIVHDAVLEVDFFGKSSLQIKVTYDAEVGHDIWYFYFHPSTYALQGYRFYHDEAANDGEYILLDDELEHKGVRIPQTRKWYTHKEAKFLGQDKLVEISIDPR